MRYSVKWQQHSILQQQVSGTRQSTPDSVSFVFCPTYGRDIAYTKHWYIAMALLAFNTCKEVICIRHGGRWQGVSLPATAPAAICWIRDIPFLCLSALFDFFFFLQCLLGCFSFELFLWKYSAETLIFIYGKVSCLLRDPKHLLMLLISVWKSSYSATRLLYFELSQPAW